MPAEALSCPTCNANDSSRPDAQGLHTCVYCGVRYRITGGTPKALTPKGTTPSPRGPTTAIIVGAVVAAAAIGAAVIVLGKAPAKSSASDRGVPTIVVPSTATPTSASALSPVTPPTVTAPNPTVVVEAPADPVPEAPATAHFELHHRRPSSGTTFYATGYVTNDSPYVIERPKITVVLKNDAGVEVGTAFGFADEVMAPGATQAAELLVMNPPAFTTIEFEIVPKKATYIPPRVEGLRVEPGPIEPAAFGNGFSAHGKVYGGTVPARFVHIQALAFDGAGKLLGIDDAYANGEVLQPGDSARFDLPIQPFSEKPARWEFSVVGMTVD